MTPAPTGIDDDLGGIRRPDGPSAEGGFPIPAGGELLLEPGGDHIMLMCLTAPLLPGDEVELVLQFEGGTEHPMTANVKDFAGAQENYGGMEEPSDGGGEHGAEGDE